MMLQWTTEEALLDRHTKTAFSKQDSISVPAGKAAILSRDGDYSDVYREGDRPALGNSIIPKKASLYMIDVMPSKVVSWGFGNVQCGSRFCGINGTLRLRVVSPRKFLLAYASQPLPLTAEKLASLWIRRLVEAVRKEVSALGKENISAAELPALIAKNVSEALSEEMEEKGLSVYELGVEPLFFPDDEADEDDDV